jgi:hypothetical protein
MVTKLDLHPSVPYISGMVGAASPNYAYKISGNKLVTYDKELNVYKTGGYTLPTFPSHDIFSTSTDGLVFVVGAASGNLYKLYRTDDFGDTFAEVLNIGDNAGTHVADIYALQAGLCDATINGSRVLLLGEYNVNSSRVSGGANDKVRIMKSTDDGVTWTPAVTWNTSGHQARHIHGITQDPYTGRIYVCVGDFPDHGFISWNGITAWQDNRTVANYQNYLTFKSLNYTRMGLDAATALNIVFTENHIHWITDNAQVDAGTTGIWRATKDFENWERMDSSINPSYPCDGWTGVVTPTGKIIFANVVYILRTWSASATGAWIGGYWKTSSGKVLRCTALSGSGATGTVEPNPANIGDTVVDNKVTWVYHKAVNDHESKIWASDDGGKTYAIIGRFGCRFAATAFLRLFTLGNSIIVSTNSGAGKDANCTAVLVDTGEAFNEDWPTIYSPVYWVANGGSDTGLPNGMTPQTPFATVKYAMSGIICNGSRLILSAETFANGQTTQIYGSGLSGNSGTPTALNVIEGQGKGVTKIVQPATDTNSTGALYMTTTAPLVAKKLTWSTLKDTSNGSGYSINIGSANCMLYLRDATVGDRSYTTGTTIRNAGYINAKRSAIASNNNTLLHIASSSAELHWEHGEFIGGTKQLYITALSTKAIHVYNTLFRDFSDYGVFQEAGAGLTNLRVMNNIFYGAAGSTGGIRDYNHTTDTYYDYNTYSGTNLLGQAYGSHSSPPNTNPLFIDALNGNYHLQPTSLCIGAGVSIPAIHEQATPATDFDGNTIHFLPPSIGPYDGQGDTKTITADFTPTGYSVRGTAESPAKIKLAGHDLNVDLSGLTDAAPYIQVKAGSKRVAGFIGKGANTYIKGSGGGSGGEIFGSNFS